MKHFKFFVTTCSNLFLQTIYKFEYYSDLFTQNNS